MGCAPMLCLMATARGQTPEALQADIRHWYDGYLFAVNGTPVYNPFSTLRCLQFHDLGNHWMESGTSTMLYERIMRHPQSLPSVHGLSARILDQEVQDPPVPDTRSLMYDTGHCSLRRDPSGSWRVDFPNQRSRLVFLPWPPAVAGPEDPGTGRCPAPWSGTASEPTHGVRILQRRIQRLRPDVQYLLAPVPFRHVPHTRITDGTGAQGPAGLPRKLLPSMELYCHALLYAFFVVRGLDVTASKYTNLPWWLWSRSETETIAVSSTKPECPWKGWASLSIPKSDRSPSGRWPTWAGAPLTPASGTTQNLEPHSQAPIPIPGWV